MTPAEFKAWFDGFTEAFTGCPTKAQWARVKERVSEIDGEAVTERVYVDRYIDRYWRNYPPYWQRLGVGILGGSGVGTQGALGSYQSAMGGNSMQQGCFNGLQAMGALGRAEASQCR